MPRSIGGGIGGMTILTINKGGIMEGLKKESIRRFKEYYGQMFNKRILRSRKCVATDKGNTIYVSLSFYGCKYGQSYRKEELCTMR